MNYFFLVISAFLLINYCYSAIDQVCDKQKESIGTAFKEKNPISKFIFTNDTKTSVQVTWAGENSGKIILVTTKEVRMFLTFADLSDIYFSDNNGKTFEKITEKLPIKNVIVRKNNGLQRSSTDNQNIFLVCYDTNERSLLLITNDGGINWKKVELDFVLDQDIEFHPTNKNLLLTVNGDRNLYISVDGGNTWKSILEDVQNVQWSSNKKYENHIFAKVGKIVQFSLLEQFFQISTVKSEPFKLVRSTDNGKQWKTIKKEIYGFIARDKFLYVSEVISGDRRRLTVSTDNGEKFHKVYLPTIYNSQFYSIMDIEEDLVYIHVDNPDNRGDGTLFTSDSDGRMFSQSLKNHFYPSRRMASDFYKVKSMRGTYIAIQLKPDSSMHSLITFNRGAEWNFLRKPDHSVCHNISKTECYLQVAGTYSIMNSVASFLPLSSPTAVGLVLVHGHLANSLKNTKSDIYVSSDGGYNWIKALDGPHDYVIADHGGLLIALGENKKVIKFSTDEGRCWHEHQYTTEDIHVIGLLTEPGNKAMTVLIWGYNKTHSHWVIHVVDLSQLLKKECSANDYEKWYAHSEMMHPLGSNYSGCLLGKKEIFLRLKRDSLCKNGYSHQLNKSEEICPCTKDDFECEYGYFRTVNSSICVRNTLIREDICVEGVVEKIITQGYKKIPADVCEGGFLPDKTKQQMLNKTCIEDDNSWNKQNNDSIDIITNGPFDESNDAEKKQENADKPKALKQTDRPNSSSKVLAISICSGLLFLFILLLGFIITSRRRIIRTRTSNLKYKVLAGLSGRDVHKDGDDEALITNEAGYESISPSKNPGKKSIRSDDSDVDLIG